MTSETLVVRLPLSSNQVYTEELVDLTNKEAFERPHNPREIINNHRLSYFNNVSQESILADDRVGRSKLSDSRTLAPNVPTAHRHTEGSGAREDHLRSSPENRPSASQNPLQDVTASPILKNCQVLPPDYADPTRLPGTDQNIYPHAPISLEFHERYPQLVDFFKQAVDSHKFLKYHTSKINYELRLCGSTPSNAVASIIIFCDKAIFKDMRSLLKNKHIQRQYQPKKPSVLEKFQYALSKPYLKASVPVIAPFKIIFWREATTPTERRSAMEQVVAKSYSFLTMCGSLVRYGNRTSTMGLLISVDSKLYGLTVNHLFKNQRDEEQPTITNEPDMLPDEDDTEANQGNWSWVDDVIYEDMDSDRGVSDDGSVTSERSYAEVTTDHGLTEHDGDFINGHKVDSLSETNTSTPFLDWALIEFDSGYFERPNAFYSEEDPVHPKFIAGFAASPKTSRVHVFMISGVSGTRTGVMLNSISYIGGKPGEKLCQAWNVILSDSGRVIDGDCGSLVVDQETLEVYGHVVASNPLGEAYVVPLRDTFHQITDALGAKDLSLPSPRPLMENLVTYYSKAGDSGVADEAKLILASMEGLSSISNPHDVEGQIRKDLAVFLKQDLKEVEELERSGVVSLLVRRLPLDITETELPFMLDRSKDFIEAEVLSPEKLEDPGFRSVVLRFKSHVGALEAKNMLDSKTANGVRIAVEILYGSPTSSGRYTIESTSTADTKSTRSSSSSTGPSLNTGKLLIDTDSVDKDGTGELKELPEAVVGRFRFSTLSTIDYLSRFSMLSTIATAITTATRLNLTVQPYEVRNKSLGRLHGGLNDLVAILKSLEEAADGESPILALLEQPVRRCVQVCREFEDTMRISGGKSKPGLRGLAKIEFMAGDVNDFIDTLRDYEATIAIGLGTITLRSSLLTQKVVGDYNERIQNTSYSLEIRLQRIDEKITSLAAAQPILSEDSSIDLQDEKAVTEQCLRICKRATYFINDLQIGQRALQKERAQQGAEYVLSQFEAQLLTNQTLNESKENLVQTIGRLQERLDSVTFDTGPDRESERLQWEEDIKQCLEVCKVATTQLSSQKIHIIGEVIADEDCDQVVVTSLADLFNVRLVKFKSRTTQLLGSMSANTLRELSKDRHGNRSQYPMVPPL